MGEHFNGLTPAEAELLALLAEECAEVIQAVAKIQRHGIDSYHPNTPRTASGMPIRDNRADLERELGDVRATVQMLVNYNIVSDLCIKEWSAEKTAKVGRYLHHAKAGQIVERSK